MFSFTSCALLLSAAIAVSSYNLGPNDVVFHLYTRNSPLESEPLMPSDTSIMLSSFLFQQRTVITIHNHGEGAGGNFNAFVVPTHLGAEDVNLIAVDWSAGSSMYSEGLASSAQCGQIIANFVNILINRFGYAASNVRIVGVGLGGHIAGIAARQIGNVPHIIALDPSLHGWTHNPNRLSADDADIVEVLHTTAGELGYDDPLGDIDFYPNGGTYQPGCATDISCSHIYSYAFYGESITAKMNGRNKFIGTKCESYAQARQVQCSGERDIQFGGPEVKTSGSGIYSFVTNPTALFAQN